MSYILCASFPICKSGPGIGEGDNLHVHGLHFRKEKRLKQKSTSHFTSKDDSNSSTKVLGEDLGAPGAA